MEPRCELQIEPLTPADAEALQPLARATSRGLDLAQEVSRAPGPVAVVALVAREPAGEQPLAFVLAQVLLETAEVIAIATHPTVRRRGLARALMRRLFDELARHRANQLWLEVSEHNQAARALYAELGFRFVRRRKRYYPDGSDALELSREVRDLRSAGPGRES